MNNYKRILIIVLGACLLLGTGCINEETEGQKIGDEVLRCLGEDDTQGLKDVFCAESQTSKDLENQIQVGMDFFDGKDTSHFDAAVSGGESVRDGETVKQSYSISYNELKTDTGKIYTIIVVGYFIDVNDPDRVGISEIDIYDDEGNVCKIGEWID